MQPCLVQLPRNITAPFYSSVATNRGAELILCNHDFRLMRRFLHASVVQILVHGPGMFGLNILSIQRRWRRSTYIWWWGSVAGARAGTRAGVWTRL